MATPAATDPNLKCVEHGIWTPIPIPAPMRDDAFTLRLKDVDQGESNAITTAGAITFHMVGCSGDFSTHEPQLDLAKAMAAQALAPGEVGLSQDHARAASFLYLLGDVVYRDDDESDPQGRNQQRMYVEQFYQPYTSYTRPIFAIAGNHDGKHHKDDATCAIGHFFKNFCAPYLTHSPDNFVDSRPAMTQPYIYWRLSTPMAYVIGLYTNIANGGLLDDPRHPKKHPQYEWLVRQLEDIRRRNAVNSPRRAVLLAVHYPPYSGSAHFAQRSNPSLGWMKGEDDTCSGGARAEPVHPSGVRPLAGMLEQAFADSGLIPDLVVSAHAHLYQRLTSRYADGREVPYLIAGSGGHAPVENFWERCDGHTMPPAKICPFDANLPAGLVLLPGQRVQVEQYDDRSFGFLRITVAPPTVTGEFFTAHPGPLKLADSFTLNLETHRIDSAHSQSQPR